MLINCLFVVWCNAEHLESWKQAGIRAVWVKISIDQNALIGGCVRVSFLLVIYIIVP